MHSDKFSDKGLKNKVKKLRNSTKERSEGKMEDIMVEKKSRNNATLRMERKEAARIHQENKDSEALLEKGRKTIRKEEEKVDFFPSGNHRRG